MTTLEKMIKYELDKHNVVLAKGCTIKKVEQYIEDRNAVYPDVLYTPEMWLKEILECQKDESYATDVIYKADKDQLLELAVSYLAKQKALCFEQTGRYPDLKDYEEHIQCEEFIEPVFGTDEPYEDITISDIINYLL